MLPLPSEKGMFFTDMHLKNGSSRGQNLALTVFCVLDSLDSVYLKQEAHLSLGDVFQINEMSLHCTEPCSIVFNRCLAKTG